MNTPAIDSFLAYSEFMKASDNIENLTYEEACLLDEQFRMGRLQGVPY